MEASCKTAKIQAGKTVHSFYLTEKSRDIIIKLQHLFCSHSVASSPSVRANVTSQFRDRYTALFWLVVPFNPLCRCRWGNRFLVQFSGEAAGLPMNGTMAASSHRIMLGPLVAAIDQGTSSTRFLVREREELVLALASCGFVSMS